MPIIIAIFIGNSPDSLSGLRQIGVRGGADRRISSRSSGLPILMLVLAIHAAWCGFGGVSIILSIDGSHRSKFASHPNALAAQARMAAQPRLMLKALDAETFDEALRFDGITVVKFYAPWCAMCRRVGPSYKKAAAEGGEESGSKDVRFYEVNFAENKDLCRRERVFALPMVHFYTRSMGRINRFTLTTNADKVIARELDRYVGASGHLSFLRSLRQDSTLNRLGMYKNLVGVLQAFQNVGAIAKAAAGERAKQKAAAEKGTTMTALSTTLLNDLDLRDELESLFTWVDSNDDGVIDARELAAVAAAVCGAQGCSKNEDVYASLLERAALFVTEQAEAESAVMSVDGVKEDEECDEEGAHAKLEATLDRESFFQLMVGQKMIEISSAGKEGVKELMPAFESLDTDADGEISRVEFLGGMERVCVHLGQWKPDSAIGCREWAEQTATAFEVLDRDKSGTIDYEEFVAFLSGVPLAKLAKAIY